jgi:AcrR family transcriptional regulator
MSRSLSPTRIVDTALQLADREGLSALTLRRVAAELHTGQASLYRHIADRDALVRLLGDRIAAEFPLPDRRGTPRNRLLRQWTGVWDVFTAHPWVPEVMAGGIWQSSSPAAAAFGDAALQALGEAGLGPADTARAYSALWHLLLGQLLDAHPHGHPHAEVSAADYPALRKAQPRLARPNARSDYLWALNRLLDGIISR